MSDWIYVLLKTSVYFMFLLLLLCFIKLMGFLVGDDYTAGVVFIFLFVVSAINYYREIKKGKSKDD